MSVCSYVTADLSLIVTWLRSCLIVTWLRSCLIVSLFLTWLRSCLIVSLFLTWLRSCLFLTWLRSCLIVSLLLTWLRSCLIVSLFPAPSFCFCSMSWASCNNTLVLFRSRRKRLSTSGDNKTIKPNLYKMIFFCKNNSLIIKVCSSDYQTNLGTCSDRRAKLLNIPTFISISH